MRPRFSGRPRKKANSREFQTPGSIQFETRKKTTDGTDFTDGKKIISVCEIGVICG